MGLFEGDGYTWEEGRCSTVHHLQAEGLLRVGPESSVSQSPIAR